jgi:hypothetical protein
MLCAQQDQQYWSLWGWNYKLRIQEYSSQDTTEINFSGPLLPTQFYKQTNSYFNKNELMAVTRLNDTRSRQLFNMLQEQTKSKCLIIIAEQTCYYEYFFFKFLIKKLRISYDVSYFARRSTKASKASLNHLIALDSTREMRAQCTYNPLKKQSVQSRDGVWFLLLLPRITIFAPI